MENIWSHYGQWGAEVFKKQTGIDYYDEKQRNELMDKFIGKIIEKQDYNK